MQTRSHLLCCLAALSLIASSALTVRAQSPPTTENAPLPRRSAPAATTKWTRTPGVQQTSFDREKASGESAGQSVTFGRQPLRVGDQSEQTVSVEMRMKLTMRRANELLGNQQSTVRTNQRRVVTTTDIDGDRTMAVTVHYPEATKQIIAAEAPTAPAADGTPAANAVAQYQPVPQPVQGKTYLCRREPGDNGKLVITTEAGSTPPKDELDIVAPQMDTVGRPNPLVQFLAGRTVTVGQPLEVPREFAGRILNLSDKFGEVTRFTLTLRGINHEAGIETAEFLASVDAVSNDASQMRLEVEGPLTVQVNSCRPTSISLTGPIALSESRGSYSNACQVIGTGHLQLAVASAFHSPPHAAARK